MKQPGSKQISDPQHNFGLIEWLGQKIGGAGE